MTPKGQGRGLIRIEPNISKTVEDTGSVTNDRQREVAYDESNGHMTDDVT